MEIAILIAVLAIAPGGFVIRRGVRGKRVGDHPICVACGYDLYGQPVQARRCPECGADLSVRWKAVRIGRREVRRRMVWAGIAIIVVGTAAAVQLAVVEVNHVDVRSYEPAWLLTWFATGPIAGERVPATEELIGRMITGRLTQDQINAVADEILPIQADTHAAWLPKWGEYMEAARAWGYLSTERWQAYANHAPVFRVITRPTIRRGDPVPIFIQLPGDRASGVGMSHLSGRVRTIVASLDGESETFPGPTWNIAAPNLGMMTSMGWLPDGPITQSLKEGENKIHLAAPVEVSVRDSVCTVTREFDITVNVLPASRPSVTPVTDSSLRTKVLNAVYLSGVFKTPGSGPGDVCAQFTVDDSPCGVSFRVFSIVDNKEVQIGEIAVPAHGRNCNQFDAHFGSSLPERTRFVLRPDPEPAIRTTDVFEYWNEAIVTPEVSYPYLPPARAPH